MPSVMSKSHTLYDTGKLFLYVSEFVLKCSKEALIE